MYIVYVPYRARTCSHRGEGNSFKVPYDFATSHLRVSVNAEEAASCLASMKNVVISERNNVFKSQAVHFSNMSDDVLMFETALNKEQLQYLLQFMENGQLHTIFVTLNLLLVFSYPVFAKHIANLPYVGLLLDRRQYEFRSNQTSLIKIVLR